MGKVLALVDRDARDGTVRRSACVLLTLARRLGEPVAVLGGGADTDAVRMLSHYGATHIYESRSEASDVLVELARKLAPTAILIASGYRGQEAAARIAVRLDAGIITDAVDLRSGPDGPIAVQLCLAASHLVESVVVRGVPVITVRPEAAAPQPSPAQPAVETIAVDPEPRRTPRRTADVKPRTSELAGADIVLAGGRGLGGPEPFRILADLAATLGAALAGSHTAAELGWIPREARVGLTGTTIHPRLYLAAGVSGSVRHQAGMQGAKTIVAIGDDPRAPIFGLADLGVVGDARAILPALLAEVRKRKEHHLF